jgi:hypothetical protein
MEAVALQYFVVDSLMARSTSFGVIPFLSSLALMAMFVSLSLLFSLLTPCRDKTQEGALLASEGFRRSNLIALGLYRL